MAHPVFAVGGLLKGMRMRYSLNVVRDGNLGRQGQYTGCCEENMTCFHFHHSIHSDSNSHFAPKRPDFAIGSFTL